jgi:hypothetical protein
MNAEITKTDLVVVPNSSSETGIDVPKLEISYTNHGTTSTLELRWGAIQEGIKYIIEGQKRQSLLIEVIRNYIRKINLIELNDSLEDEDITDDDYDKELSANKDKYVITLRDIKSPQDAIIISDLMHEIGYDLKEFSTSEVGEMFSVKESQLMSNIKSYIQQLK